MRGIWGKRWLQGAVDLTDYCGSGGRGEWRVGRVKGMQFRSKSAAIRAPFGGRSWGVRGSLENQFQGSEIAGEISGVFSSFFPLVLLFSVLFLDWYHYYY